MSVMRPARWIAIACAVSALVCAEARTRAAAGQGQVREFNVTGTDFAFSPSRIEVQKGDLVKITFTASDIPHSFTMDQYRISKRAGTGQSVTFEVLADQAGSFDFYCNLKQDERCRRMRGTLVVR